MDEEKEFGDLVEEFLDQKKFHHFEGDQGLDRLNVLCGALGYRESGFKYGSPLEQFLSDNPGAQTALVEWISDQHSGEWIAKLDAIIEKPKEEEEEEEKVRCQFCKEMTSASTAHLHEGGWVCDEKCWDERLR